MIINIEANNIIWDTDGEEVNLPTDVTFGEVGLERICEYYEDCSCVADWLSDRFGWLVESLDTHIYEENDYVKPIYALEGEFMDRFDDALHEIETSADEGDPLTLEEVLGYGFNNVSLNGKRGYEKEDFTVDELQTKVTWSDWDRDSDGYRYVILKEVA